MSDPEEFGVLKGLLEGVSRDVGEVKRFIHGNGQKGLLERQTRIEDQMGTAMQLIAENAKDIGALQTALTQSVKERGEALRACAEEQAKKMESHASGPKHDLSMQLFDSVKRDPKFWLFLLTIATFIGYTIYNNIIVRAMLTAQAVP